MRRLCSRRFSRLVPVLLSTLGVFAPFHRAAADAQLFVHPTLVLFSGRQRSETIYLVNQGDATGVFELGWVDFAMTAEGGLLPSDGVSPWSLQPYARYSPRRVTLRPGETQLIRVALRAGIEAAAGEYYSHLRAVTIVDRLEPTGPADSSTAQLLTIATRTAIAIPIIWRNSMAAPRATIESVETDSVGDKLVVDVRRLGEVSTRGYLHVLDQGSAPLADPLPLIIYPSADRRIVSITMKRVIEPVPGGDVKVIYAPELDLQSSSAPYAVYTLAR